MNPAQEFFQQIEAAVDVAHDICALAIRTAGIGLRLFEHPGLNSARAQFSPKRPDKRELQALR